ncbi:hypothetical protein IKM56_00250 [Candidatus Saccharibacteria bacterium]|nr:hypothetical protein [Candidatus Saccharibacteria bacterium]
MLTVRLTIAGNCADGIVRDGQEIIWRDGDPVPPLCLECAAQVIPKLYAVAQGCKTIDGGPTFKIECPDHRNGGRPFVVISAEIIEE